MKLIRTHRWREILGTLIMVAVLSPLAIGLPALAADQSLVLEALGVLQQHYVDRIDPVKMLNAALAGVRAQLPAAGTMATLSDIPADLSEDEAKRIFLDRFTTAVNASNGNITQTQLAHAAIRGMTDSFKDSHTGFLTPQQNAERRQRQRGQAGFSGVGIILAPRDGKFFVMTTIPGGPAEAAGVKEFDRILRVNDVSTSGMQVGDVSGMVRGPSGTQVSLTLQRPGLTDPMVVTVTRAPISTPAILKSEILEGGVGYIKLWQFVERTGRDFRGVVSQMQGQGMRALVLDLRGNSGGFLTELNSVLNAIMPAGLPVYTEIRKGGNTRIFRTVGPALLPPSLPMVVLIDENSASAAELLAMAIKEHRRGQLIGEKTAGAVEASLLLDLSDGSALSVTTFRLASGMGVRLEGAGVDPDMPTALTTADIEAGQDKPLGTAVRLVRQYLALPAR
ncbi:MAG TPA: S41 family peptidase [bacterium]|nr:S41 family peptidase [bacterium]